MSISKQSVFVVIFTTFSDYRVEVGYFPAHVESPFLYLSQKEADLFICKRLINEIEEYIQRNNYSELSDVSFLSYEDHIFFNMNDNGLFIKEEFKENRAILETIVDPMISGALVPKTLSWICKEVLLDS